MRSAQSVRGMMSLETFQNVDDWRMSTDVGSLWELSWKAEELGFVHGLDDHDDNTTGAGYLTSPCIGDGLGHYDVTASLSSPLRNSVTEVTECWVVDVNDEVPPPCVNKASDGFFSSNEELLNDAFSVHQLCSVGEAGIQLPEVAISELESLLMMESEGEIIGGADYITVNADELEPVHENTGTQFDFVHHDMEEVPATVSYDVDEDQSTSLEEDDSRDMTWSYRRSTRRKCLRRRHRQLRSKSVRRLSRNSTMDERKKLQNKSAATRYREKKRSEEIENEMLCVELEKRNKELRSRVQDMTQEVAVLRQLVIDIFRSPTTCSA